MMYNLKKIILIFVYL